MLRRWKRWRNLVRLGVWYGGRSRNLWERLNFHPEQRGLSYFTRFHSADCTMHRITFCPTETCFNFLQVSQGELYLTLLIKEALSSFPTTLPDLISLFSHIFGLKWAFPMDRHLRRAWNADYCGKARHYELPPALGHSLRRCSSH